MSTPAEQSERDAKLLNAIQAELDRGTGFDLNRLTLNDLTEAGVNRVLNLAREHGVRDGVQKWLGR